MKFEQAKNLQHLASLEWLETNGLGGFAGSSVAGMNTRRYHGVLVAANRPPVERFVMVSKLEETLLIGNRRVELSCNQYPGAIHPAGYVYLTEFRKDPFPTFVYQVEGFRIEKRLFMVDGENTTIVEYEINRDENRSDHFSCSLELRPLLACRDYHSLSKHNDAISRSVAINSHVSVHLYEGAPALHFAYNAAEVHVTGDWYYNFEYRVEQERGLDYQEDLFNAFCLRFDLTNSRSAGLIISTEKREIDRIPEYRASEMRRRAAVLQHAPGSGEFVDRLTVAADQFIVKRNDLQTVIAGYHWFSDWGRDTMIALPGLNLVTGRFETARKILKAFANSVDEGMLPNRWPDYGERAEYNTVDATLWFFEAVNAYLRYTGDLDFIAGHLMEVLKSVIDWHIQGTRFGIRVNELGLLNCGEPGTQLTWMDAKIGDRAFTPRNGMPVEIQALWYNALRIMQALAQKLNDGALESKYREFANQAEQSFRELFWNSQTDCLFDVIDGSNRDASIRPNQIFALSLTHPILPAEWAPSMLATVERELLTPYGLRTLAASDPQYCPHYNGGVWERDSAYHQGTVWPWLLGPFISAYVRTHKSSEESRQKAAQWLAGVEHHLDEACIGQISEIFDAEAPFAPRGCVAQAWSVAEILRATVEDISGLSQHLQRQSDLVASV